MLAWRKRLDLGRAILAWKGSQVS